MEIGRRIDRLNYEIMVFDNFEKKVTGLQKDVYFQTIKKHCVNLSAKAEELHLGRRQLFVQRGKILKYLAKELGEYLEEE